MPDIKRETSSEQIDSWLKTLLNRCDIGVVRFRDGSNGLLNVPNKYVRIIDAMHVAMCNLAAGEALPAFTDHEAPKRPARARKRPMHR
jgi:hypothetical protein